MLQPCRSRPRRAENQRHPRRRLCDARQPATPRERPPTAATRGVGAGASSSRPSAPGERAIRTLMEPDPELFREVFGRFATGVAVITSAGSAGAGGMTANALCSLSLDPLLALVCFETQARTLPIVREAGRFAVNLLAADQAHLAGMFASKLPEAEKLAR